MMQQGYVGSSGSLGLRPIRGGDTDYFWQQLRQGLPQRNLPSEVQQWRAANLPNLWRGLRRIAPARALHVPHFYGVLSLNRIRPKGPESLIRQLLADYAAYALRQPGISFPLWAADKGLRFERLEFGTASFRVVTTAGVGFIVDAFQNSVELEIMRYHGIGTGNTAEDVGDTDIETELTTQYSTNSTRATGSLTEGASANIFRSVGTNTVDASVSIVEHGLLSDSAVGSGVLLDRTVFSTISLGNGDSLQSTYDLTLSAGS